jgi:hypothetical protein
MGSRTPTQLHASLYMRECFVITKRSDSSKNGRAAKTGKFIAVKEVNKKKR